MLCAIPFGVLLTVKLLADHVRWWPVPVAGFVAGAAWVYLAPKGDRPEKTLAAWSWALAWPVLRTLIVVAGLALICYLVARRFRGGGWRAWSRRIAVALIAATLGGSIATGVSVWTEATWRARPATPLTPARTITTAEMKAALWLNDHAGNDDIVATNVHCVPIGRSKPCDARAFWVAGIGGRRTVVESWGYSDATVAANGVNGLKYPLQPAPDPEVFALNQRVFTDAQPADLARLRAEHDVRWLFADSRAGKVSPGLAALATVRLVSGPVTIYELGR